MTILFCHSSKPLSVWGQNKDSVSSLIHSCLGLPTFIYLDLKSQMAFSVFFSVCLCPSFSCPAFLSDPWPCLFKSCLKFRLSTSLVLSERRTWCNFLLISSSLPLWKRAHCYWQMEGERERRSGEYREQGRERDRKVACDCPQSGFSSSSVFIFAFLSYIHLHHLSSLFNSKT